MKWLLKEYMAANHIDNFKELARQTGIKLRTLRRRIDEPSTLLLYEIRALDEVLHFNDEDKLKLISGNIN